MNPTSTPTPGPLVIRLQQLPALLGVSMSALDRLRADPANRFPSPVHLGVKARGFRLDELQAWIASRQDSVKH